MTGRQLTATGCVIALIIVAAAAILVLRNDDEERMPRPEPIDPQSAATLPLPSSSTPPPKAGYLSGDASLVQDFRDLSAPLLLIDIDAQPSSWRPLCEKVAEDLWRRVSPEDLASAAASIDDPVLAELELGERTARSDLLLACMEGDRSAVRSYLGQAQSIDVLVRRRLES